RRQASLAGDLGEPIDDVEVLRAAVPLVLERVGLGTPRSALALPRARTREEAAGERAPRNDPDALVDALRDHLPLLLAVDQVVVGLHRAERGPAVTFRDTLGLGELPRVHAPRADVPGLAGLHSVVPR